MADGSYTAPFGGGEQTFRLRIGELEELQERCDAGPEFIVQSIYAGTWRVAYVREAIRLGLIGAGMAPTQAQAMRDRYCSDGQLAANKSLAANIIGASLMGSAEDEEDPPGEPTGETDPSPAANGGSDGSTKPEGS